MNGGKYVRLEKDTPSVACLRISCRESGTCRTHGVGQTLTTQSDNFPFWSPDGERICFTRTTGGVQTFDIFTIRPDGSELRQLTDSAGNDSHCVWSSDGQSIIFSSSRLGYRDEAPLYDAITSQPYSELFIMRAGFGALRNL